jgi:hypothetical protein
VVRIGCGRAGFTDDQMAPLFLDAPANCSFDPLWEKYGLKPWNREQKPVNTDTNKKGIQSNEDTHTR